MSSRFVKTNIPGYVKDQATGMILNSDMGALALYKAALKRSKEMTRVEDMEKQLAELRQTIAQLSRKL